MLAGFPKWGQLVGGQFGQNGQKLHKKGDEDPPVPSTRGNSDSILLFYL